MWPLKNKKTKIKFYNTIPGVDKTMPIIPSKEQSFDWKKMSMGDFQSDKKTPENFPISMARCPGITALHHQGWIVRSWQDVIIETNGDGVNFSWRSAISQRMINNSDYVSSHNPKHFQHIKDWGKHSLKTPVKINTGWCGIIPKGYVLLQIPVAYSDNNLFLAMSGVYKPEYGVANINIPLQWFPLNSKEIIPSGTPLAQLILVKQEDVEMEITEVDLEKENMNFILLGRKFVRDYNGLSKFWKSFE